MKKSTPIRNYMTQLPVELQVTDTVGDAMEAMQEAGIRHIPVLEGMKLVGIISRQDLSRVRIEKGVAAESLELGKVCVRDLFTLGPLVPLPEAAQAMLERGVGTALIVDGDVIVGIFSRSDALRVVADL